MADDIDIEEHGVMFPDLSIVKEEFDIIEYDMEYELEASSPQPSTSAGVDDVIPDSTTDMYQEHGAPCEMTRAADSPHMVTSTQEDAAPPAIANCIILGSKPTANCTIFDSKPATDCIIVGSRLTVSPSIDYQHCTSASVPLLDWSYFLRDSRTYCHDCRTLFATVNALDAHKMHAHFFLVATDREQRELPPPSPEVPVRVRESDQLFYRCHVCGFPSSKLTLYKRHMETFHNTVPDSYEMHPLDLTCPHCERSSWTTLKDFRMHLRTHSKSYPGFVTKLRTKLARPKASDSNMEGGESNLDDDKIVAPKSSLFRCSKCDVHFLNSSMAVSHYNTCNRNRIESYRCVRCKLHLKLSCRIAHLIQHKFADKFTALEISDEDIRPRILARCPRCAVHYSVQKLSSHVEKCVSKQANFFRCQECRLNIDERLRRSHEFRHQNLKYEANDFITIDYRELHFMKFYKFYYCKTCKCFMNLPRNKITNHMKGFCRNKWRNACSICGLTMMLQSLRFHRHLHRDLENYNLGNFKFYNLDDRKPMRPLPEYHRCNKCNIHFHVKTNLHKCSNSRYQKCHICDVEYSDSAYKLHMAFHDIGASPPDERSQIVQEKRPIQMYYCNVCQSYLHQKNHRNKLSNCKLVKKYLCSICGLLCCFRKTHQELHHVLNFKLQDITFYSIPDLKLIKPPPPKYRQCTKCRVHCTILNSEEHECHQENSSKCEICDISLSERAYKLHMPFHSYTKSSKESAGESPVPKLLPKRVTLEENFNIVPISSKRPGPPKDIVDEKRTHLIEKSPDHDLNQTDKRGIERSRTYSTRRATRQTRKNYTHTIDVDEDKTDESYTRDPDANDEVFTFYQCRTCQLCLTTKRNDHICVTTTNSSIICDQCGLKFNTSVYNHHKRDHKNPKFVLEKFKIIPFSVEPETTSKGQNDNNEEASEDVSERTHGTNRPATRRRGYMCTFYQCSSCKICVYEEENIKSHTCVDQDFNRYKCDECGLYLSKSVQDIHQKSHEMNPEFVYENFKIIPFSNKVAEANRTETYTRKDYTFHQCSVCSFCVTDRMDQHSCATKEPSKRVTCKLCGLYISKHLNSHKYAPSFVRENFTILPFSRKIKVNDTTSDVTRQGDATVEDSLESVADDDLDNADRCETASMSTDAGNEEVTKTDKNTRTFKFYQCTKCSLCLRKYSVALRHKCIKKVQPLSIICRKCGLYLDNRNFESHLTDHKNNRDCNFEIVPFVPSRKRGRQSSKHLKTHIHDPSITRAISEIIPISAKTIHKEAEGSLDEPEIPAQHENSTKDEVVVPSFKFKKHIFYKCTECEGCLPEDRVPEHYVNKLCATLPDTQYCEICENKFPYFGEHVILHKKLYLNPEKLSFISINNLDEFFDKINKKCVYQCYGCKTILFSRIEMEQHKDSCLKIEINDFTVCRKCRLVVCNDEESLATHETKHQECSEFVHEHITVVHFDSSGVITDTKKTEVHILYECVKCKVCFTTQIGVTNHIRSQCTRIHPIVQCKPCGILINKHVLPRHNYYLHSRKMTPPKILVIPFGEKRPETTDQEDAVNEEEQPTEEMEVDEQVTDENETKIDEQVTDENETKIDEQVTEQNQTKIDEQVTDENETKIDEQVTDENETKIDEQVTDENETKKDEQVTDQNQTKDTARATLYLCKPCGVHLMTARSVAAHALTPHRRPTCTFPCPKCGLRIIRSHATYHRKLYHENPYYNLEYFIIKDIRDLNPSEIKKIWRKQKALTVKRTRDGNAVTSSKECKKKVYYKCKNCNVVFLSRKQCVAHFKSHVRIPDHDFVACKICGKNFLVDSLRDHMSHHKMMELTETNLLTMIYSTEYQPKENDITEETNQFLSMTVDVNEDDDMSDGSDVSNGHACDLCTKKYRTQRARDLHINLDHMDELMECPICGNTFHKSILNDLHLCVRDGTFKCCVCGISYPIEWQSAHAHEHATAQAKQ